jgi:AcrR family transcriptional regulator
VTERLLGFVMNSKEKILIKAKKLFSEKGFAEVSMRNLAKALNLSVAAIYHHFPNKNALYLETVQYAFTDKEKVLSDIWLQQTSAEQKLELFVHSLVLLLVSDAEFHRLIQREILSANPERMKLLAEDVFNEQFCFLRSLMKEIKPNKDAHLSAISVLALCKHHIEMEPLRCFLPGWEAEHEQADVIAQHVLGFIHE